MNKLFTYFNTKEGQKGTYPPDSHLYFTRTDDNVFVETDLKDEIYIEEKNEIEQLLCDLCESKFKNIDNLKRHDQRFHIKQGTDTTFKCDFCNEIFEDKRRLCDHIKTTHKKCSFCAKISPTAESLEIHQNAVHRKGKSKHKIERDPSMKNHKNKRHNYEQTSIHDENK